MVWCIEVIGHDACVQGAHDPLSNERTDVAREQGGFGSTYEGQLYSTRRSWWADEKWQCLHWMLNEVSGPGLSHEIIEGEQCKQWGQDVHKHSRIFSRAVAWSILFLAKRGWTVGKMKQTKWFRQELLIVKKRKSILGSTEFHNQLDSGRNRGQKVLTSGFQTWAPQWVVVAFLKRENREGGKGEEFSFRYVESEMSARQAHRDLELAVTYTSPWSLIQSPGGVTCASELRSFFFFFSQSFFLF